MEKKRKTKVLGWLFSLALVIVCVLGMSATVWADTSVDTWAELQAALATDGTVVLGGDIIAAENSTKLVVPSGKTVTLNLNGHKIDYSAAVMDTLHDIGGSVITVNGGNLTLEDLSTDAKGEITGGKCFVNSANCGGGVFVSGGSFTMMSGAISGNSAINGGGVYIADGNFIMKGGKISNNGNSQTGSLGGGVFVDGGEFLMEAGKISGNELSSDKLDWGGGVYVANGNFIMKGGKIADNKADYGGGVSTGYTSSVNPLFTMTGGEISGNTAVKGGGVSLVSSDLDMSGGTISQNIGTECGGGIYLIGADNDPSILKLAGKVIISGNKNGTASDAANSNVYIETTTARERITLGDPLTEGASVGVGMKSPGTFTTSESENASKYASFFSSDNENYVVQDDGNELKLANAPEPDTYPVWVGKTQVKKENKGDVLGDGKVSFDPTTKTLTLDNPTIEDVYSKGYTAVIYSELDSLVIKGKANLTNPTTGKDSHGIYASSSDVELNGDFKVKAGAYCVAAKNLTVSGGTVDAENGIITIRKDFSITGGNVIAKSSGVSVSAYGKINISGGSLNAETSSDYGVAIHSTEEITIGEGLVVTNPKRGTVDKKEESGSEYWTVFDGDKVASSVTIEPAFPVWVGATQVTEKNKNDVLGDGGKATYDPATRTLTLDNPEIKDVYSGINSPKACIYAETAPIVIEGKANLTNPDTSSNNSAGIYASGCDVELNGEFSITAGYYGIGASRGNITISGNVNVTSDAGIQGRNIEIKGGTLTSTSSLWAGNQINFGNGLSIVRPEHGKVGSYENTSGQWILNADGTIAKPVVISSESDLVLVTFVDGQGKILKAEAVKLGGTATAPANPTRSGYTFDGWDKKFSNVTEDLTVTAKWKATPSGGGGGVVTDPVQEVINKINALTEPYDQAKAKDALKAYDELTDEQRADKRFTEEIMKKLAGVEAAVDSADAADFSKLIAGMPDDPAAATADQISDAVIAYKALSDSAKKLVPAADLDKLQTAMGYPATTLKAKLNSVKTKKGKKALVKWEEFKIADGYQLFYKAKGVKAKKVDVAGTDTVQTTVKKLKPGKKYTFKVRTYMEVEDLASGEMINVYGKWSNAKKAKAKK